MAWRRRYTYPKDKLAQLPPLVRIVTPESRDAPIESRDNRFWIVVALVLVVVGVVALVLTIAG